MNEQAFCPGLAIWCNNSDPIATGGQIIWQLDSLITMINNTLITIPPKLVYDIDGQWPGSVVYVEANGSRRRVGRDDWDVYSIFWHSVKKRVL